MIKGEEPLRGANPYVYLMLLLLIKARYKMIKESKTIHLYLDNGKWKHKYGDVCSS